jgi:hypothetical protein
MAAEIRSLESIQLLLGNGATVDEGNLGKLSRNFNYDVIPPPVIAMGIRIRIGPLGIRGARGIADEA